MPTFVHLAPESLAARIRRNGIHRLRKPWRDHPGGLFAVPVTPDFFLSHHWVRELRRRSRGAVVGVYFRIPDDETVRVGHYRGGHERVTAAAAVARFLVAENRYGWEVIIPRRIEAREIRQIRALPQVVGWRYYPGSNGQRPFCACKYCVGGQYGARRLRDRLGFTNA